MSSRIIKFRYWSYEDKRFVTPRIWCRTNRVIDAELNHSSLVQQQFTGLKDKNEKEIYEGDVLQVIGYPKKYLVEWCTGGWGFTYFFDNTNWYASWGDLVEAEIIGNIFENSELLNLKDVRTQDKTKENTPNQTRRFSDTDKTK